MHKQKTSMHYNNHNFLKKTIYLDFSGPFSSNMHKVSLEGEVFD